MKPARFHPDAEAELIDAVAYHEDQRPGLGVALSEAVESAVSLIRRSPELFERHRRDVRGCMVERFPYTVFYREFADEIWIAAVAHQRRRPGYWLDRSP